MFKFNKTITIPFDNLLEIRRNEYVTLQLIPTKSNKNNTTDGIASLINKMYIKTNKLIKIKNKKLEISIPMKASYYIHITNEIVEFYFIVPKCHLSKFKAKFAEIWKNIEVKEVDQLPVNVNDCTKYQLQYKMHDALSLNVDKRSNNLLNANMSVLEILEKEDSVGIFYNFIPTSERESNYFLAKDYKEVIERYKNGENLKKSKNIIDLGVITLKFLFSFLDDLINAILSSDKNVSNVLLPLNKEISPSTKRKAKSDICKTQMLVLANSKDKDKEKQLAIATCNTFKIIGENEDNELVYKEVKKVINIRKPRIYDIKENNTSIEECSNFIALPGKEIIEQYKAIEHNKILEIKVPNCLQNGTIRIGTVKYKDTAQEAYYSTDKEMGRMGRVLLGSMGAGKSYYMKNLAKDIVKNESGLVLIDIIDRCQLSDSIKEIVPEERLLEIDCSNIKQLQAFSYNELKFDDNLDTHSKISIAMQKAQQLQILLDAINDDNAQLTPRMLRYLYAAATVMFYKNINASFKNIIDVLTSPVRRANLLDMLSKEEKNILIDEVDDLLDLNKVDKKGNIENYDSKIDGIIDRISWLKTNMYTKLAFNKDSSNNIDFIDAINQKKIILIKIPEKVFNSKMIRNVIATFYLSKIWLAKQLGATEARTELFFDEIHQSYNCQLLLEDILVECRKFNLVPTLAMHYLSQCTNKCKNSILASGSSFLLISGCDPKAFNDLYVQFEKHGYDEVSIAELERYHALCLIKNEEENYSAFVAKLPS